MEYRIEHDSLGEMKIAADRLWGAQTQRSLENFPIGTEKMPKEIIDALAIIKSAAAGCNFELGKITAQQMQLIQEVCQEIKNGELYDHFPLAVWQTGSGTQSNMNINEVIAIRGNNLAGTKVLHPNDHVNCSQSSNDVFPTAIHIAALLALETKVKPALKTIIHSLQQLQNNYPDIIKIGRTHLQDAVPIKFAQEVSGWQSMFEHNLAQVDTVMPQLLEIALGATAVGTGLNAPRGFAEMVARAIAKEINLPVISAPNKMYALASKDELAFAHGCLKAIACNLMKVANDVRWLGSGPRCGLGELNLPANEPGSSIMPGKVNPTQCEAATMVAVQVMGNDATIGFAASQGNFELNVFLPVCIYNFLQSTTLLSDCLQSFSQRCLDGLTPNFAKMADNLHNSLMLATALNPHIGYENAAKAALYAHKNNLSLLEALLDLQLMSEAEFKSKVDPTKMV